MTRFEAIDALVQHFGCTQQFAEEILLTLDQCLTFKPVLANMSARLTARARFNTEE